MFTQDRLAFILHFVIATTLIGSLMTFALSTGYNAERPIFIAALIAFVIAVPVIWLGALNITHLVNCAPERSPGLPKHRGEEWRWS